MQELVINNNNGGVDFSIIKRTDSLVMSEGGQGGALEFDPSVSEIDKWDYMVSAAAGTLTSLVDAFWQKEFDIINLMNDKDGKLKSFVTRAASVLGYSEEDFSGALNFLGKKVGAIGEKALSAVSLRMNCGMHDFSEHPSAVGLIFHLLSQITGKGYGIDENGGFAVRELSCDELAEGDVSQKIFVGAVSWTMQLANRISNVENKEDLKKSVTPLLVTALTGVADTDCFKRFSKNFVGDESALKKFTCSMLNGLYLTDGTGENDKPVGFKFEKEAGIVQKVTKMSIPVLMNECLVRAFYFVRRFFDEVKVKGISNLSDISLVDWNRVLPYNNRTVTRMLTVSSGVFMAGNTVGAAVKSIATCEGNKVKAIVGFVLNINYVGVGKLACDCYVDSKYIKEDVNASCELLRKKYRLKKPRIVVDLDSLYLTEGQTQIAYSLMYHKVKYDILKTGDFKQKAQKQLWLNEWAESTVCALKVQDDYILKDETELYNAIQAQRQLDTSIEWVKLVIIEIICFAPYYMLETNTDNVCKGIAVQSDFVRDVLGGSWKVVTPEAVEFTEITVDKYLNKFNDSETKLTVFKAAASFLIDPSGTVFSIVMGADALGGMLNRTGNSVSGNTRPVMMLGKNMLGMSAMEGKSALGFLMSKDCTLIECAKLISFCEIALIRKENGYQDIRLICQALGDNIMNYEMMLLNNNRMQKQEMKLIKYNSECLQKCLAELEKLCYIRK